MAAAPQGGLAVSFTTRGFVPCCKQHRVNTMAGTGLLPPMHPPMLPIAAFPFPPPSPEEKSPIQIVFGIILGASASVGINLGNNIQAVGLRVKASTGSNKVFVIGTVIFISTSILNFAAFSLAPASLLAPLESLQFVTNLIFGK